MGCFPTCTCFFRLYCVQNNHAVRANYVKCIFKKSKDAYKVSHLKKYSKTKES
ncbi:hypothetical protein RchiOBHm_Chr1g0338911 [Rosa chinensis]|uniref:Uncharacterized protein n=1 Tax=Rosa chinensis TaxID=74649 RepID=A0A2P6SD35_ROSCH|nr:hypothetical protein RchiOBHm_Chr1g0338911 [Rosa chinensis]